MNTHRTPLALLVVAAVFSLAGCGPQVEDSPELYERRRPACEQRCGLLLDPECGAIELAFSEFDECVELCMSDQFTNWALQEDKTDACFDEVVAWFDCTDAATCEEQHIAINFPNRISETPCKQPLEELLACNAEHLE